MFRLYIRVTDFFFKKSYYIYMRKIKAEQNFNSFLKFVSIFAVLILLVIIVACDSKRKSDKTRQQWNAELGELSRP